MFEILCELESEMVFDLVSLCLSEMAYELGSDSESEKPYVWVSEMLSGSESEILCESVFDSECV